MQKGIFIVGVLFLSLVLSLLGACSGQSPDSSAKLETNTNGTQSPIPTPEPIPTTSPPMTSIKPTAPASPTPSATPTLQATPTPTLTLTPTPTPSITPTPSKTTALPETSTPPKPTVVRVDWESVETNEGLITGPILKFTVTDGKITDLILSVFPEEEEWVFWFLDETIEIQENKFTILVSYMPEDNNGKNCVIEGTFVSEKECKGTITFPKGFFWVDFTMQRNLTIAWTAHQAAD